MGLISRLYNFVSGTVIDSEQVDAEFNQILAVLNGGIDSANVTDGSLALADLATTTKNSFLKLNTVADKKVAFGVNSPGASWGVSPELAGAIPHGLSSSPSYVSLTATTGVTTASGASVVAASVVSVDATNINYKLRAVDGGNANFPGVSIYWAAIV